MRLVVKKSGNIINEFSFDSGPVYIGRYKHNQVFLPDLSVSRQHAAIFTTLEGNWVVEDMDSANRTFLNGEEVRKAELKTGDVLRISDFTIEIDLETAPAAVKPIHLEDTLVPESQTARAAPEHPRDIIIRKPELEHAPDIKLPARRIRDFIQATELICKTNGIDELLKTLLNIVLTQLNACQVWCALRDQPEGPMVYQEGKKRNGSALILSEIKINRKITEAIGKNEFVLLPLISNSNEKDAIRSAMIAPIIDPSGCFGLIYAANSVKENHYGLSDLDYLMMLAIHTAAIVENF
ncbi:MAG: FHA domain-containing protein [Sedimentisphaerales bacterium]|nr:FHA domain-containing protein [Sedimentisphaerales bacterium]